MKRIAIGLLVSLGALALLDQLALRVVVAEDKFMGRRIAPFDPPVFSTSQVAALARVDKHLATGQPPAEEFRFDAELGWVNRPNSGSGEFRYDWAGSRIADAPLPREKTPGVKRILAIGCSMTHGEESAARDTWAACLDRDRADLEIANLGVAGYGIDQALLRLRRDGPGLEGDEVWLSLLPAAALRVTTLFRPVLRHWSLGIPFKPRLQLKGEALEVVPCPVQDLAELSRVLHDQEAFLAAVGKNDRWVQNAPLAYAERGSSVLHSSFLGRLALTAHERLGRDHFAQLSSPDTELYRLVRAIILETGRESEALGAHFRFIVMPAADGLAQVNGTKRPWTPLVDELTRAGIEVFDLTDALTAAEFQGTGLFESGGHYSSAGNQLVAGELSAMLDASAL